MSEFVGVRIATRRAWSCGSQGHRPGRPRSPRPSVRGQTPGLPRRASGRAAGGAAIVLELATLAPGGGLRPPGVPGSARDGGGARPREGIGRHPRGTMGNVPPEHSGAANCDSPHSSRH